MDPIYAAAIGVDVDELLISQPDTGEQALEITDMLIRSGALDVVVIDSVAALTPRAEIEGEMGDTHVGLQARLMSQALRKLTGQPQQDRHHLHLHQPAAGEDRRDVRLLVLRHPWSRWPTARRRRSARSSTRSCRSRCCRTTSTPAQVVPRRRSSNWFDNGATERVPAVHGGQARSATGEAQFARHPRTTGHRTPGGWREAGELTSATGCCSPSPHHLSDFQWQVLLGGLMGDGALSPTQNGHGARFRGVTARKQAEYGDWKASLFANVTVSRSTNAKGAVFHDVSRCPNSPSCARRSTSTARRCSADDYLKQLTPLSLAIWYMDDGSFTLRIEGPPGAHRGRQRPDPRSASRRCQPDTRVRLRRLPRRHLGHRARRCASAGGRQGRSAVLQRTRRRSCMPSIAPFIHPSMEYKLLPDVSRSVRGRAGVRRACGTS